MRRGLSVVAALVTATIAATPTAHADNPTPSLPTFTPHPSDWQPDTTVYPYNLWQIRVTPEQVAAMRDSCQWFNAQYDQLMSQVFGFQHFLDAHHDVWQAPGVQQAADTIEANLDQSAAFLDPKAHTLYITNYPDQSEYSPVYNGDSMYHLWYQLTQIIDNMKQQLPSGQLNAHIATANVYGTTIRDSGVCANA
ncbi:hypothetical protein ORI20_25160 [Mycobacterium sp. CVI_P3]|uniref:Secreted protein n=1 Tax=Mycobacterium pinniadriaticum TaxID=2994102 RepID=A0ABT3SK78_9MYCO|nr:hypothetical protein [Mycobacterium pinniadriaticum]MCX2933568.1 hypothetical protein [Mycobacterium pinniadriaticum]MCX2939931.1 hypothetical protein [Mycobacterium pinniadriaticum]